MQIEPSQEQFAEPSLRGEPPAMWTTLIAASDPAFEQDNALFSAVEETRRFASAARRGQ